PEAGAPGPAIGFLQECVRFFAHSLDGADTGFFDEPRLVSYLQEPVAPAGSYPERPGRWVADPAWPSPAVTRWRWALTGSRLVSDQDEALTAGETADRLAPRRLRGLQTTGVDGGVWCGDGSPA